MALFAALIAPYFIDWSSYRTAFEAEAGRIIGQPVKVRGDADARLLPFPSVTFTEVVVGDEDEPSMSVSRFSMDAELAPFLRGEVRIIDMRVENPTAVVRILEDGRLDWAIKRTPAPPGDLVVLEKVSISDADITVVDEQNGRMHHIRDIEALVSAGSLSGPWSIEAEGEIAGHRGRITVNTGVARGDDSIRMRVLLAPDQWPALLETEGEARIENNKPLYDGLFTFTSLAVNPDAAASDNDKPLIVAKGDFAATNERLSIEEWRAEIGLSDDPYILTGQATIDTGPNPDFLLTADGQQINMDRLGAEEGQTQSTNAMSVADRLAVFNALIDRLPPPPLPGRVSLNLPAIIAGDTTLREISLNARPDGEAWLVDAFSANLPGRTVVEAQGRLVSGGNAGFEGALTVASTQPSGLANWLSGDVDPVIRRLGAAGFSANVSLSAALQRFEALEVAIGPAILKGRLERELPPEGRPSLSVELAGDTFDVDAVRALAVLAGAGRGAASPLSDYNLAARIKAGTLTQGPYSAEGVEASLVWRDQELTLERLTFDELAGVSGRFSASLGDFATQPTGRVEGDISGASAQGLFRIAEQLTGGHALVQRLARNAYAYDDLQVAITLNLEAGTGPGLTVAGEAGGSTFALHANGPGLRPGATGSRDISLQIENPEAYRLLEQAGLAVLPLEGEGPASLKLDLSGNGQAEELAITAALRSGVSTLGLEGTGAVPSDQPPGGRFALSLDSPDVEPFAVMFSLALPRAGAGLPLQLTANVTADEDTIALGDLAGTAAGNRFSGALDVERRAEVLNVSGGLALDDADIAWISEIALGPSLPALDGATWNSQAFLPPAPGMPELNIALEAGRLDLGRGGVATELKGQLTTASGIVSLSNAGADWFGGRIGGDMSLTNADGAAFVLGRVEVEGADLAALDQAVRNASPVLKGVFDAKVSLEGTGDTMRDVVASLAGGGELVARNLVLDGIDPGAFARILGTADREDFEIEAGAVTDMVARFMVGGEIAADRLAMPFTLTGGVLRFSSAAIDAVSATLSGDARVDLLGLRLESDWRLVFDPGVEAIAGGEPSVVLSLAGLLVDPALTIDAAQMTNYLSMRAFERERRKVELLQAGVVEKQRLRREVALLRERQAEREAAQAARIAAEEAARLAAEEAARLAAEEAARHAVESKAREEQKAREAEAAALAEARAREEAAREAAREEAARHAAEEAARQAERLSETPSPGSGSDPRGVERRPLAPPGTQPSPANPAIPDPPSAIADDPPPAGLPELQFDDLPGVNDPIRSLIAPGG